MNPKILAGLAFGMAASIIWGGHAVVARLALAGQGFHLLDLAACRFIPGALLLGHLAWGARARLREVGLAKLLVLTAVGGLGNFMVFVGAMIWAPASHGGTVAPMTAPVAGALAGWLLLAEKPTSGRLAALGVMLAGVLCIGWDGLASDSPGVWKGDVLLLLAGGSWGFFGALLRRWQVPAFPAAGAIAVVSAVLVTPLWLAGPAVEFVALPWASQLWMIFAQGVMLGVLAMLLFTRSVELLGPTRASTLSVVVPITALLLAAMVLGEALTPLKLLGAGLALAGMLGAVTLTGRR
ncbi:DMT family transporter [Rhodovarius sp.]|uniref:DMT family transporter n=1 Tax=Rhodovarius sp. TaxID=2972673 RepID=UPI0034A5A1D7